MRFRFMVFSDLSRNHSDSSCRDMGVAWYGLTARDGFFGSRMCLSHSAWGSQLRVCFAACARAGYFLFIWDSVRMPPVSAGSIVFACVTRTHLVVALAPRCILTIRLLLQSRVSGTSGRRIASNRLTKQNRHTEYTYKLHKNCTRYHRQKDKLNQ